MRHEDLKELLSAYADGQLQNEQRDIVEKHLVGCTECRETLEADDLVAALKPGTALHWIEQYYIRQPPGNQSFDLPENYISEFWNVVGGEGKSFSSVQGVGRDISGAPLFEAKTEGKNYIVKWASGKETKIAWQLLPWPVTDWIHANLALPGVEGVPEYYFENGYILLEKVIGTALKR